MQFTTTLIIHILVQIRGLLLIFGLLLVLSMLGVGLELLLSCWRMSQALKRCIKFNINIRLLTLASYNWKNNNENSIGLSTNVTPVFHFTTTVATQRGQGIECPKRGSNLQLGRHRATSLRGAALLVLYGALFYTARCLQYGWEQKCEFVGYKNTRLHVFWFDVEKFISYSIDINIC